MRTLLHMYAHRNNLGIRTASLIEYVELLRRRNKYNIAWQVIIIVALVLITMMYKMRIELLALIFTAAIALIFVYSLRDCIARMNKNLRQSKDGDVLLAVETAHREVNRFKRLFGKRIGYYESPLIVATEVEDLLIEQQIKLLRCKGSMPRGSRLSSFLLSMRAVDWQEQFKNMYASADAFIGLKSSEMYRKQACSRLFRSNGRPEPMITGNPVETI